MIKAGLLLVAALAACKAKEPPSGTDQTGSQAGAQAGSQAAGPVSEPAPTGPRDNMTGLRPHRAENCPSSLPGTTTRITNTPRGVDVAVTSRDPATVHRITELAERQARGRTAEVSRPHDQHHGGSGWVGYCPVMVTDQTQVTITPRPDGAVLHVDARSPDRVSEIQTLIKARAVQLPGYLSS